MPYKDPTVARARARIYRATHEAKRKAERVSTAGIERVRRDDDRGLRRLLIALGLPTPPPPAPPQRTILRLQWHRAGAARTPVLVAVVRLPSTTEQWMTQQDQDGRDRPRRCNDNVWRQG